MDLEDIVDRVLNDLDGSYEIFKEQIISWESSLTFEELQEILIAKELNLQKQQS